MGEALETQMAPVGSSEAEEWYLPDKMLARHPGKPHIAGLDEYRQMHQLSIQDPDTFWGNQARELLSWETDFHTVQHGSLSEGNVGWFLGGKLNACFNCVDRHALKDPKKVAIIHETDDGNGGHSVTYGELLKQVSKVSWVLKDLGVRKGDTVAIYMPMVPVALVAILACARIGAVHSVVFAGFSAGSLRDRITDAKSKVVITADESQRGGKTIGIKKIVDEALSPLEGVQTLVFKRTGAEVGWVSGRDHWWHEEVKKWPSYIPPVSMDAEDPLFLLYTSGSTGKPKGILHTTGGYLVGAAATGKYVFDIHGDDRYFCAGDVGWITGHTYVVYAPLLLGVSTVVFEGTPTYPSINRYWDIIANHKITHFYVAPTALRLLKRAGSDPVDHDTGSLRVLGSVGEPIAPEIWKWYFDTIGKGECHVVDTYWQTETGSHAVTPLAGVTPTKPGSACLPFFGIDTVLIDPVSGEEIHGNGVEGVLAFRSSWPSMARTVYGDHSRFQETYLDVYKGYYFTGDGASRDQDGFYWIRGRVDDVINVSGHRLSTAEIEAAMVEHPAVAESAVVGIADELTGQSVVAFVCLKEAFRADEEAVHLELRQQVRKNIGPFAAPKNIFVVTDLPKTRSGKIMRRVLRKVVMGEQDQLGDVTTLSDPSVVGKIIDVVHKGE
ncbi:Acetyl-coenzyme A synthetase [Fusarium sp. AF-6]|nr:Acetyl-coenzyme A synthetase [Fusarium sp. AF-6]